MRAKNEEKKAQNWEKIEEIEEFSVENQIKEGVVEAVFEEIDANKHRVPKSHL